MTPPPSRLCVGLSYVSTPNLRSSSYVYGQRFSWNSGPCNGSRPFTKGDALSWHDLLETSFLVLAGDYLVQDISERLSPQVVTCDHALGIDENH